MSEEHKLGENKPVNRGNAGKGRPIGAQNKATKAFRETVTRLLEDNAENVSLWLARVAADNPKDAIDMLAKLAEYATPKLARQEVNHSGETGLNISVVNYTNG